MKYVVALQDLKDLCCFRDAFECTGREEAKRRADKLAAEKGRPACVFNIAEGICYRTGQKEEKKRPEPQRNVRK